MGNHFWNQACLLFPAEQWADSSLKMPLDGVNSNQRRDGHKKSPAEAGLVWKLPRLNGWWAEFWVPSAWEPQWAQSAPQPAASEAPGRLT